MSIKGDVRGNEGMRLLSDCAANSGVNQVDYNDREDYRYLKEKDIFVEWHVEVAQK